MGLERDADDNRTALITPSNARFTDLGMLVSRLTFIQQRSYDRRCRTSNSCHIPTLEGSVFRSSRGQSDAQIPKMTVGTVVDIEADAAMCVRAALKIVDD
jgi:hypothetical protein